jgi:RecG-like helicase
VIDEQHRFEVNNAQNYGKENLTPQEIIPPRFGMPPPIPRTLAMSLWRSRHFSN